jgi:hypothetical protein
MLAGRQARKVVDERKGSEEGRVREDYGGGEGGRERWEQKWRKRKGEAGRAVERER